MTTLLKQNGAAQLNFINRSNDKHSSRVVIFQKAVAPFPEETAIAWQVISTAPGQHLSFQYQFDSVITASDSFGNFTNQQEVQPGQRFHVSGDSSAIQLSYFGSTGDLVSIALRNDLKQGAINAWILKSGKKFAGKTGIVPGQKAVFHLTGIIGIVVVSDEIQEGEVLNSSVLDGMSAEFPLAGIAGADIVMTGGGEGSSAVPYHFELKNITRH